jgi:hypothetical protein
VSVAVGTHKKHGDYMARELIRSLDAWDIADNTRVRLNPGTSITGCQIHRNIEVSGTYLVSFESSGRVYWAPLVEYQARTRFVETASADENPAREALTV